MKKMFFALAALVLAFTGCSQEDEAIQTNEQKAVKVVVNMDKPGFGTDTRAARTGWEEGDEVVVTLAGQLTAYVKLTYQNDKTWETAFYRYDEDEEGYIELTEEQSASFIAEIETALPSGSVKAAYFSSGVLGVNYNETYVHIITKALTQNKGECIMTCEDGEYSVSGGALTLNITMIPQVAQFTIKDLNVEDDYIVCYEGTITAYASGIINADGVELNPVGALGGNHGAWVHDNKDGISIYASPWEEVPDGFQEAVISKGGLGFFCFFLYDTADNGYYRDFHGKSTLKNGGAVIFDGPTTPGAVSWITPIP